MPDPEHPTADLLLRFLHGQATRAETCEVVRHLLAGCPRCLAVMRHSCKHLACLVWTNERPRPRTRLRQGRRIQRRLRDKKG